MTGRGSIRVLTVLWRLTRGGGVPVVIRGFLKHFDRSAFDVHVCTVRPLYAEDGLGELGNGITYHSLGLAGARTPRLRARATVGVARVVRRIRPQVLQLQGGTSAYGLLAALAVPGAKRAIAIYDAPQSGRMSRANRRLERLLIRRGGFHPFVNSRAVRRDGSAAWGIAEDSITLLPLGVDIDAFAPDPGGRATGRAMLGVAPEEPLVSYVARISPEKRPELFLAVARRILEQRPEVHFALVGGGGGLDVIRDSVGQSALEDRVRVPGFVADLAGVYHASDLFVSTSRYEGFGLAIAEAMAAGLPVVSTRVGGVEDVVGEAGILEESDDPEVLAGHVLALLNDPERRQTLGEAALKRARSHLDVRATARGFEAFYRSLCEPESATAALE